MTGLTRFACLAGAAGAVFVLCVPWVAELAFDAEDIRRGEIWRLAGAHLAHLSPVHALVNALGFGLVGAVLLALIPLRHLLVCMAGTAAVIDAVFLMPMFHADAGFVGFSAILYALATLSAWLVFSDRRIWGLLIAAAVALSLASGYFGWRSWGFEIATGTHVVGIVCGSLAGAYLISSPRQSARRNS